MKAAIAVIVALVLMQGAMAMSESEQQEVMHRIDQIVDECSPDIDCVLYKATDDGSYSLAIGGAAIATRYFEARGRYDAAMLFQQTVSTHVAAGQPFHQAVRKAWMFTRATSGQ